jgi:ABC-type sugar transport system ATPase subunit
MVEMLGAELYVHVAAGDAALTARVPRDRAVKAEETVVLGAAARALHLFDPATGAAI